MFLAVNALRLTALTRSLCYICRTNKALVGTFNFMLQPKRYLGLAQFIAKVDILSFKQLAPMQKAFPPKAAVLGMI